MKKRDENIMQDEHRKNDLNDYMMNALHTQCMNGGNKHIDYRKILKDIGIEKSEGELLTEDDLCWIFIYAQEGLCT